MRPSSLQLEHVSFTRIRLDAVVPATPPPNRGQAAITVTGEVMQGKDDPVRFMVQLTVAIHAKDGATPTPYEGEVTAFGIFRVATDVPEKDRGPLVLVNGKSMLYGIIREMVANLSARSANGPLLLHTVNFCDEAAQPAAAAPQGKPAKP